MNFLLDPMILHSEPAALTALAGQLAPQPGYNPTALPSVRILRSETILEDVPVLYRPGAAFVLQGSKQGFLDGKVYRYDADHYLAVSVPVPFRMASQASRERPLLAIYVEFDLRLAAEIVTEMDPRRQNSPAAPARSLVSSRMEPVIADVLLRTLRALHDPDEIAILGPGLLRELHYRVLVGPQGCALAAALKQRGPAGRIVQSLARIRESVGDRISVAELATEAGMSVPSYHTHFRAITGSTPIQYVKAMRLHEARLMIARQEGTIAAIAIRVGYASPAQFSRDFKRHFRRSASEEARWMYEHLGEIV